MNTLGQRCYSACKASILCVVMCSALISGCDVETPDESGAQQLRPRPATVSWIDCCISNEVGSILIKHPSEWVVSEYQNGVTLKPPVGSAGLPRAVSLADYDPRMDIEVTTNTAATLSSIEKELKDREVYATRNVWQRTLLLGYPALVTAYDGPTQIPGDRFRGGTPTDRFNLLIRRIGTKARAPTTVTIRTLHLQAEGQLYTAEYYGPGSEDNRRPIAEIVGWMLLNIGKGETSKGSGDNSDVLSKAATIAAAWGDNDVAQHYTSAARKLIVPIEGASSTNNP